MKHAPSLHNLHVPLPASLYRALRAESERSQRPATELARSAIDHWLKDVRKRKIHDAIGRYASEHAGSAVDLDRALESAAVEAASQETGRHKQLKGTRKRRR